MTPDTYPCPNCNQPLTPSQFKAHDYKRSAALQLRCVRGCGRLYTVRHNTPVLDVAWVDHDFLIRTLFRNGVPHPKHVDNYRAKHFDYMPTRNFYRSFSVARNKFEAAEKFHRSVYK